MMNEMERIQETILLEPMAEPVPLASIEEPEVEQQAVEPLSASESVPMMKEAVIVEEVQMETMPEAETNKHTPEEASASASEECKALVMPDVPIIKPAVKQDDSADAT